MLAGLGLAALHPLARTRHDQQGRDRTRGAHAAARPGDIRRVAR